MERGLYIGAMGMNSLWGNIETIANNLANIDTSGYKKDTMVFNSLPSFEISRLYDEIIETPIGTKDERPCVGFLPKGVAISDIATIHTQGLIKQTGNPFDLAIFGDGFFAVLTEDGERYTRDGRFAKDNEGFLVTLLGDRILSTGNIPIQLGNQDFIVLEDGVVISGNEERGRLKVVDFENKDALIKIGDTLFKTDEEPKDAILYSIKQGYLEMSNVEATLEMVRMIEVQRLYEVNSKVVLTYDELISKSINQLGIVA